MKAPLFSLKHIGINTADSAAAKELSARLCDIFGLTPGHENDTHIFAGGLFEVMKHNNLGTYGHIALQTENVEDAIVYFAQKGIGICEETIRKDNNGTIVFAYLKLEIGGFAVHLTQ